MVCIYCSTETQVINSRHQKKLNHVWRRRRCSRGHIFTTLEKAGYSAIWHVEAVNGRLSPFQRDKLFLSLLSSLGHRKTAIADAGALVDTIMSRLETPNNDAVIPVAQIVTSTQVVLNRFDTAASVHYRAFHPNR
jgi:transcriptional regulator NrdR family protein